MTVSDRMTASRLGGKPFQPWLKHRLTIPPPETRLSAMVWRIHFTAADLARTRISTTLGPLAETMWALSLLRCPLPPPRLFSGWQERAGARLSTTMNPVAALVPPGSRGVDLCTLAGETATIEKGVGALLAAPRDQLLAEMEGFDRYRRLPASAWTAADPGSEGRRQLADAVDAAYRALIEPYWIRIHAHLQAEQAFRGRILMHGGVERLLTTLQSPGIRWQPPILEIRAPGYADFHLDGRGLILIPSWFVGDTPALHSDLRDYGAVPRLMFPAASDEAAVRHLWSGDRSAGKALAALVGRTRAAALGSIADGCTTTELARRAGISVGGASQHATVLREAGLVTTRRNGSAVLHVLTPLGAELLQAAQPPAAQPRHHRR
jgi:DNA-binding transcriptional ArsR family regulator